MATDWAASDRVDEFHCYLVDPFTLKNVKEVEFDSCSTSVSFDYGGSTVSGASVTLDDGETYKVGGKSYMVRLVDNIEVDGTAHVRTFGTFFVADPTASSLYGRVSRKLSCYSSLKRFGDDVFSYDWQRSRGTKISDCIKAIVEADGGKVRFGSGVDVNRTCETDIWFELGSSKLDAIRTIASWLWCDVLPDDDGTVLVKLAKSPDKSEPAYTFEAGVNCVYKAGISWTSNQVDLCNRVVYYLSNSSRTARAEANLADARPGSYKNVGYHKTAVVKVSEEPSGGLQAAANAYLADHCGEVTHIEIEHVDVPTLRVGDTVRYINSIDHSGGVNLLCQIVQQSVGSLTPGCMTKSKLKVVKWQ